MPQTPQGRWPPPQTDELQRQVLRVNAEWRRWEEADKWHWDEGKRKRWAEGLWRAQQLRHLRRVEFARQLQLAEARQRYPTLYPPLTTVAEC